MPKFYGKIGFGQTEDKGGGVWVETITERSYYGDVTRNSRRLEDGSYLHKDITVGNTISIVADPYALDHFFTMRYIEWSGTLWTVEDVTVQSPRLLLRLGGVYNGPVAAASPGAP